MNVILITNNLIWQRLKCVYILSLIMQYHTINVHCNTVLTIHVSIFLTKKQIINIQTQHPQYGFTFITYLRILLLMVEFHRKTRKYVACVNKNLRQTNLQKYTPEKSWLWWRQNFPFFYQFLYNSRTKVCLSPTICVHTWYKSLWWVATHSR